MVRLHTFVFVLTLFQAGCTQYTRDMFRENKLVPTPYEEPEQMVRPETWRNDGITYAWLGHATVLINFYGTLILTDPVLLDRIGPPELFNNMFGIKRIVQLPIDIEDFPAIDLVLISHSHFDHLDMASLSMLKQIGSYTLVVPAITRSLVSAQAAKVIELDWLSRADKTVEIDDLTISAFRVEHYSFVNWGERDIKRGFNGYLMVSKKTGDNENKTIAFFGDTSYSRYRDEYGNVLNKPLTINWQTKFDADVLQAGIDLCIIPIGDSYYYWNHISPQNAVRLASELNCKKMLPIHYSTFILTPAEYEPVKAKQQLLKALKKTGNMEQVRCQSVSGNMKFPDIAVTCKLP